jgi:hypothetical protein
MLVLCSECGLALELSVRREYEHRRQGMSALCPLCRKAAPPEPTARHRRYWIERLGLEEARELAAPIWPR